MVLLFYYIMMIIAVVRQQFVFRINCSIFLYRNSFEANQFLALTRNSVRIAQVPLCAVQQVTPCILCVQIYCVLCQKPIIWKGYELLVICIRLLSAEFSTVNTGLGRSMFWKALDLNCLSRK